jgi:putative ABC transport system ATP-binding protein
MLKLTDIRKNYRARDNHEVAALDGVSFELNKGEFVAVQGPSGCGKSTLLLIAGGLLSPDAGTVTIDGADPYAMSANARAGLRADKIGFVFQQFHLAPYLSVRDNIMAPDLAASQQRGPGRADELIKEFGLSDRATHVPDELSTGERQRVALARALFNNPGLILADEPTGNLDPDNSRIVLDRLRDIAQQGAAVLMVTHDETAAKAADRIEKLREGKRETA